MMKIQSVAILGAGAVGCYVLWGLADKAAANSLQLGVVAEGSRAERLRQNGCTINGQVYHPQVWTPQQAHGVDLLIVALKYGALPGALDSIRTIVSERTVVMSLMNGVDSEELIAAQVGAAHVLPALIKVASHRAEDGVWFDPETTIGQCCSRSWKSHTLFTLNGNFVIMNPLFAKHPKPKTSRF